MHLADREGPSCRVLLTRGLVAIGIEKLDDGSDGALKGPGPSVYCVERSLRPNASRP